MGERRSFVFTGRNLQQLRDWLQTAACVCNGNWIISGRCSASCWKPASLVLGVKIHLISLQPGGWMIYDIFAHALWPVTSWPLKRSLLVVWAALLMLKWTLSVRVFFYSNTQLSTERKRWNIICWKSIFHTFLWSSLLPPSLLIDSSHTRRVILLTDMCVHAHTHTYVHICLCLFEVWLCVCLKWFSLCFSLSDNR